MMPKVRLIAQLEIKGPNVIKGIRMEGLRVVGQPAAMSRSYFEDGIDEIYLFDTVASLYGRNQLCDLVSDVARDVFVPVTVGGGIRSVEDFRKFLRAGADKIAINTQAVKTPELISEAASVFGSQCVIVSIQAKRQGPGVWEPYVDNGRERTGLDVVSWAMEAESLGAGEILLTSVDRDGTCQGLDLDLISAVSAAVSIPVIASGGSGSAKHVAAAVLVAKANAVAVAHVLHFNRESVQSLKAGLMSLGVISRAKSRRRVS